jgi:(1->4)-alpha-D-glucan 1-alpha-D-glucosylmutase
MPVYRTYVSNDGRSDQDKRYLDWAIGKARKHSAAADTSVFDFLESVLTGELGQREGYEARKVLRLAMRAQQISGPVMAKGMEDTAFYRYHRLISLNEVGGDPRRFGISLATFHRANAERLAHWPNDMLAGSTHDTKRGEDARARINVLSELPREWARQVASWMRINRSRRTEVEGAEPMPQPVDEYLFYQSLVGAWPLDLDTQNQTAMSAFADRVAAFMQKALREGKERSSWDNPDASYEAALERFVRDTLEASSTNPFPEQVAKWVARLGRLAAINSLGQTLLRLTIPGVPDTYRGSEGWDLSLVDPDNRRPVDYSLQQRLLDLAERTSQAITEPEQRRAALEALSGGWQDGREKLYLLRAVLTFRRQHAALFREGSYLPLAAAGERAEHVCAFARELGSRRVTIIVPRLLAKLAGEDGGTSWGDTTLVVAEGRHRCLLSGASFEGGAALPLAQLLADFPVAVLLSD